MEVVGQSHAPAVLLRRRRLSTHCIGDWVSSRAGLDGCGKSRPPTGIRSPGRPEHSSVAIPTELPGPQNVGTQRNLWLFRDVSRRNMGHIFKDEAVLLTDFQSMPQSNIPEERGSHLHRCESRK